METSVIEKEVISRIEKGILSRINELKKEREVIYKQQKSYNWTREERVNGSQIYGRLQEKEGVFNIRIFELEYALACVNYKRK